MNFTEAEKNLICMLRTRKPFETVTIHINADGKPQYYMVKLEQRLEISDKGIKELAK